MEDQLRLFLLLGGTVFIIAVLAHGIWKIRKNSKPSEKARVEPRQWSDMDDANDDDVENELNNEQEGFDELGVGAVRVVSHAKNASDEPATPRDQRAIEETDNVFDTKEDDIAAAHHISANSQDSEVDTSGLSKDSSSDTNEDLDAPEAQPEEPKLYGSVVTNPKPHMSGQARAHETPAQSGSKKAGENDFPEPPGFLLREGESDDAAGEGHSENTQSAHIHESSRTDSAHSGESVHSDNEQAVSSEAQNTTRVTAADEPPRTETKRAAQKFYVDPTLEEEEHQPHAESSSQRDVADFSLDAPQESFASNNKQEESRQPKRFSRSKRNKPGIKKREEPNFGDDQMRIDFDTSEASASDYERESFSADHDASRSQNTERSSAKGEANTPQPEQEVLVLNVRTPEGEPILGAALLPMLLTLGFKFGDQDIFHRHVNSNGKGPVLFSLANMFKPGVFDIDNLENFETQGISLFMILPIEGDPHQVFNMMHNAARKLADEFGAQVLDGRRSVLTKQGLQQYVEKIREFERKRMIARS